MIRKCTDEDISDEELEKVINPFYDNYHEFFITYIMPETIAFYIASSYSKSAMWEATFFQHCNSAKGMFRYDPGNRRYPFSWSQQCKRGSAGNPVSTLKLS